MGKLLLKFLTLFKKILVNQGIDFNKMVAIVEVKLTMDKRRVRINTNQQKEKKDSNNRLTVVLFIYGLMGLFIGILMYQLRDIVLAMIIAHAYIIFMMAMTLITDFSSVLLDTTDLQILSPKPISAKTLVTARIIHILIYITEFTIALSIVPLMFTILKYGIITAIAMVFTIALTVLFTVFITYFFYLLLMRFVSEEKVKNVITYFQIVMTIFFALAYQLLPRILNLEVLKMSFTLKWYTYFLPPVWMAKTVESFTFFKFDTLHLIMIALSFTVPILSFISINKYLAPVFARKLSAMQNSSGASLQVQSAIKNSKSLTNFFCKLMCTTKTEMSGFELTWKMTSRDKSFKLQFYPSLGYIVVYIVIMLISGNAPIRDTIAQLPKTSMYLFLLYLPILTVGNSLTLVAYNENYQAAWVYYCSPIKKPGNIISGMTKAILAKFFFVVFIILVAIALLIWRNTIWLDILFSFANNIFCFLIIRNLSTFQLPFSKQPNTEQQTGKFLKALFLILIIILTVGLHYLFIKLHVKWLLPIVAIILFTISFFLMKRLQNIGWSNIR